MTANNREICSAFYCSYVATFNFPLNQEVSRHSNFAEFCDSKNYLDQLNLKSGMQDDELIAQQQF